MFSLADVSPYLIYLAPPLVGAFIGYVTNRVAIRMLFRPLRAYHIGGLKIPMTPGVIPSKRHQLAANIGEMVGEHLLTGDEISRSLQKENFQEHLHILIESTVSSTMKKDLGSLKTIVPPAYRSYFDIAVKTLSYRVKEGLHTYLRSNEVRAIIESAAESWIDMFMASRIEDFLSADSRQSLVEKLVESFSSMVQGQHAETQLAAIVSTEIGNFFAAGRPCADFLPDQFQDAIIEAVRSQTPRLLNQTALLLDDPAIKDRLVEAVLEAIEEFVENLGPMSNMVKGFLNRGLLDDKVRTYLDDKQDEITSFFQDEYLEIRVRAALGERIASVLETPLSDLLKIDQFSQLDAVARLISERLINLLTNEETRQLLVTLLDDCLAQRTGGGKAEIGRVTEREIGSELVGFYRAKVKDSVVAAIYSAEITGLIDQMIDDAAERLVSKPIGRLDHLIPQGVTAGLCNSLREVTTRLLISEVPGVVKSINFKKIVTDRIDSFDLLRLEQLLLSIMAEQFRYINLFGALLGFLIGCANLLFMLGGGG